MVFQAAIRRLPSAIPLRFAHYDDACALNRAMIWSKAPRAQSAAQRQHHRGSYSASGTTFTRIVNTEEFAAILFLACSVPSIILRCGLYSKNAIYERPDP
jgi:hypothetical protein